MSFCYIDGKIIPTTEAFIGVRDIGILRGYSIYEAMTTYGKKPFELEAHLSRLRKSADFMKISIPLSDQEVGRVIDDLIKMSGFERTNIKFILTGGETIDGIDYSPDKKPTFYIFSEECATLPQEFFTNGVKIIIAEHARQFLPEYKTTEYIKGVLQKQLQKQSGAFETLYVWKNNALEGSTSNFFIIKNNTLVTPQDNILKGITRRVVIELAKKNGFEVEERDVKVSEVLSADECFLTSSFKDIVPVVQIDNNIIGQGTVGEETRKIMALFSNFKANY